MKITIVWMSWNFVRKFNFKQKLKVSAFYLEKQKSFSSKKVFFKPKPLNMPRQIQKMALADIIFSEGFGSRRDKPLTDMQANVSHQVLSLWAVNRQSSDVHRSWKYQHWLNSFWFDWDFYVWVHKRNLNEKILQMFADMKRM